MWFPSVFLVILLPFFSDFPANTFHDPGTSVKGDTQNTTIGLDFIGPGNDVFCPEEKGSDINRITLSFSGKEGDVINLEPKSAGTILVIIDTEPSGAMVSTVRNGVESPLGFTPLEVQVAVGEVEFLIRKDGFKEYRFIANLEAGKTFYKKQNLADSEANEHEKSQQRSFKGHLYGGWSNIWFASNNFEAMEKEGTVKRSPLGLVLGYHQWLWDGEIFFADGQFFVNQSVKTSFDAPADQLYLSGMSLSAGWSPWRMARFRPILTIGYGVVNLSESPIIFQAGKALSTHHLFWGTGMDIVLANMGFGLEYRRSLYATGSRTLNQLQIRVGYIL